MNLREKNIYLFWEKEEIFEKDDEFDFKQVIFEVFCENYREMFSRIIGLKFSRRYRIEMFWGKLFVFKLQLILWVLIILFKRSLQIKSKSFELNLGEC